MKNVKTIIITGENRKEIEKTLLGNISAPIISAESFYEAVHLAIENANFGDSVLLSPASTSFDRFSDYKERGNTFSEIIKKHYLKK